MKKRKDINIYHGDMKSVVLKYLPPTSNDNHHRRKRRNTKANTERGSRKVSKVKTDTNVRRVSRNVKPVSRDITEREDVRESQPLLRRIETYIGAAVERIRKSLHFGWNLRTCEITWEEMQGLYHGDVHALQTSTAMYAYNKLLKAGFDMNQPIHCDQNINNLTVVYHQWTRESTNDFLRKKILATWKWFLEH